MAGVLSGVSSDEEVDLNKDYILKVQHGQNNLDFRNMLVTIHVLLLLIKMNIHCSNMPIMTRMCL